MLKPIKCLMWYQNSADVERVQASGSFSEHFWLCFSLVVPRECGLFLRDVRYDIYILNFFISNIHFATPWALLSGVAAPLAPP
jgi:hypothetical protein